MARQFKHLFRPTSPAFGALLEHISELAEQEELCTAVAELRAEWMNTRRWRWLRRYHLERQLAVFEAACYAFMCGRYQ